MGKTTEARKEKMRAKGMARENEKMKDEDIRLNFEAAYTPPQGGIPRHHLLTKEEVEEIMNPPAALEKRLEKEKVEKEKKRLKQQSQWERRQRTNASTASASHEAPRPTAPPAEVPILDKRIEAKQELQKKIQQVKEEGGALDKRSQKAWGPSEAQRRKEEAAGSSLDKREQKPASLDKRGKSASRSASSCGSRSLDKRDEPSPSPSNSVDFGSASASASPEPKRSRSKEEVLDKRTSSVVLQPNPKYLPSREEFLDKRKPKHSAPHSRGAVAVDWNGTLAINDEVPAANIAALNGLKVAGYSVYLLSFGGKSRNTRTMSLAKRAWQGWSGLFFTSERTGPKGKAHLCFQNKIQVIFDDHPDIIWESSQYYNLKAYAVCDWQQVYKFGQLDTYPTFALAVKTHLERALKEQEAT